jgi:hypothetical protein
VTARYLLLSWGVLEPVYLLLALLLVAWQVVTAICAASRRCNQVISSLRYASCGARAQQRTAHEVEQRPPRRRKLRARPGELETWPNEPGVG